MHHRARPSFRPALAAAALGASITLVAGCGGTGSEAGSGSKSSGPTAGTTATAGSTSATASTSGAHNDADVAFATGMIPHHRQAIEMAEMAEARARSSQVRTLAARIKAAQGPEITTMSGWLTAWGQPVPTGSGMSSDMSSGMSSGMSSDMSSATSSKDHSGHSRSGTTGASREGMAGMMSEQDMQMMRRMSGTAFDRAFLTGMVAHHRGAVEMAETELRDGANAEAKRLAQSIIDSQNAEIDEMRHLLQQLR
jgi:uncharacterized protein (DUF305 family)